MLTIYRSQFNTHMTILIFILGFFPFQSPLLWDFMFISFPSPNNMFEFGEYSCLIEWEFCSADERQSYLKRRRIGPGKDIFNRQIHSKWLGLFYSIKHALRHVAKKRQMRSNIRWLSSLRNSLYELHFAAFFIVVKTKKFTIVTIIFAFHPH